eukprot:scaffold295099_cov26-Tisochrysis_lutea.AAC.1
MLQHHAEVICPVDEQHERPLQCSGGSPREQGGVRAELCVQPLAEPRSYALRRASPRVAQHRYDAQRDKHREEARHNLVEHALNL